MRKFDSVLVILAIAIMTSIGLVAMFFGMAGMAMVEAGLTSALGMIVGLSGIIFGIISFRYFVK